MIFDKSIKEGKLPFSCIDCLKAREFLDKEGYFTDNIIRFTQSDFKKITNLGKLYDIDNSVNERPFQFDYSTGLYYKYFLPKEWVEEPEKKYRPYSLNEFLNEHEIGDKITYRHKCKEQPENFIRHKEMICGYQIMEGEANTPGEGLINLGGTWMSLQAMFDDCETPNSYLYPEMWEPFGVEK